MPRHFDQFMISDAIRMIGACDVLAEDVKRRAVPQILALLKPSCAEHPSCGQCPSVSRCEDAIGTILNNEGRGVPHDTSAAELGGMPRRRLHALAAE